MSIAPFGQAQHLSLAILLQSEPLGHSRIARGIDPSIAALRPRHTQAYRAQAMRDPGVPPLIHIVGTRPPVTPCRIANLSAVCMRADGAIRNFEGKDLEVQTFKKT